MQRKKQAVAAVVQPAAPIKRAACCQSNIPARFPSLASNSTEPLAGDQVKKGHEGMVFIKGGTFAMGADNKQAVAGEYPKRPVSVGGFWIDRAEVTNAEFEKFVKATGYITTAEKKPDWNQLKKQLPPGTQKPDDSLLVPASLVLVRLIMLLT